MKGLELAEAYYREYGEPMLEREFPCILSCSAFGLAGEGSECFGYDDEVSSDHDFEPGFCIFIPDESIVDRRTAFLLEKAYNSLPSEFMGYRRQRIRPVGGTRHGVIRQGDFLARHTGSRDRNLSTEQWFSVPEYALAEAVNGKIFRDDGGEFTAVRNRLSTIPEPVRLKKLAGRLLLAAQSGQYNYARCLSHGEKGAALLAADEFVRSAANVLFLLNDRYMPYYKWFLRSLREISPIGIKLENILLCTDFDERKELIEECSILIADELRINLLYDGESNEFEYIAYKVNDLISDAEIRNLNILYAV